MTISIVLLIHYNLHYFVIHSVITVDTIPPVIRNCPDPVTSMVSFGTPSTPVSWIPPTAFDDSGVEPVCTNSHNAGDVFFVGVTQVTIVCRDASGNQATCSFRVTGNYNLFSAFAGHV